MKIITLAVDAHGAVHLAATRAPDLWRRALARTSGGARFVHLALSPDNVAAEAVLAALDRSFDDDRIASGAVAGVETRVYAADPDLMARRLARIAPGPARPAAARLRRWLARLARRLRRRGSGEPALAAGPTSRSARRPR